MDPKKEPTKNDELPEADRAAAWKEIRELSDMGMDDLRRDMGIQPEDSEEDLDPDRDSDLDELTLLVPTRSGTGKGRDEYDYGDADEDLWDDSFERGDE